MFQKKQQIFTKKAEITNPSRGYIPEKRPIKELLEYGVINLDKISGPTSHEEGAIIKKILEIEKVGHGGTLDPAVTGVLPIMLNSATKIAKIWLMGTKEYVGIVHLHQEVEESKIRDAFKKFVGKITQLPPKRSSVKRAERQRTIYEIEILEIKGKDVLFRVNCEHGTYIRRLCDDLGKILGIGAHMTELRRTKASTFTEDKDLVTMHDIKDAYAFYKEENNEKFLRHCIKPLEIALINIPKIWITDSAVTKVCDGHKLKGEFVSKLTDDIIEDETVMIMTLKGECAAIATALKNSGEIIDAQPEDIIAKSDRVVIKRELYFEKNDELKNEEKAPLNKDA